MYEGAPDYPHRGIWWELVERYKATIFYTAPTAIRACIKWGAEHPDKFDLSSLRLLGTVGEPINPKAWLWYHKVIGGERCPIVDTWWQTETGSIMISPLPGIVSTKPGSATRPLPGILAEVVDERDGKPIDEGQGLLVLKRPWPSMLRTLYKEDDRFIETYFKQFGNETYLVGDAARKDKDGYYWVIGRIDDVVNVSGHRLSTAEVESAIVASRGRRRGGRDRPVRRAHRPGDHRVRDAAGQHRGHTTRSRSRSAPSVAERIGKFARPKRIIWADDLPKTRSGKIMRRLLRDIAEGRALGDVTTLRDPTVMAALESKIQAEQAVRGLTAARRVGGGIQSGGASTGAACACERPAVAFDLRLRPARPRPAHPASETRRRRCPLGTGVVLRGLSWLASAATERPHRTPRPAGRRCGQRRASMTAMAASQ